MELKDCFTKEASFGDLRIHDRFFVDGEEFIKQSAHSAWNEEVHMMLSVRDDQVVTVVLA